jgi:hypothetical protein
MKKIILLDFDDTLAQTSQHIINCYNAISSDNVDIDDFICEYTWHNLPIHKELWKHIVDVIVKDPSSIPPVDGMAQFLNTIDHDIYDVIFLSKRYGKNIINKYLIDHGVKEYIVHLYYHVLVSENEQKTRYIKELRSIDVDAKITYFEDRCDVVTSVYEFCNTVFVRRCPWNKNLSDKKYDRLIKFGNLCSFEHLFDK